MLPESDEFTDALESAVSVFLVYEDEAGEFHAIIHAHSDLKALCHKTIFLATTAAHKPADGLH